MKLIALTLLLTAGNARADGGTVQIRQQAGPFAVTVFTGPGALTAGPTDISVLVQQNLEPVLDAVVTLQLEDGGGRKLVVPATRGQAQNKLFYAAEVTFPTPGTWRISVDVASGRSSTVITGTLPVAPANPSPAVSWLGIGLPSSLAMFFIGHQLLVHRQKEGRA